MGVSFRALPHGIPDTAFRRNHMDIAKAVYLANI